MAIGFKFYFIAIVAIAFAVLEPRITHISKLKSQDRISFLSHYQFSLHPINANYHGIIKSLRNVIFFHTLLSFCLDNNILELLHFFL